MKNYTLFIPWLLSLAGTVGALFYSELHHIPPCTLCWYQRAFMFPLAIILGIAAFRGAYRIVIYALPLALIGLMISAYHVIFMFWLKGGPICAACTLAANSTTLLPFPVLSLLAFLFLTASLIWIGVKHSGSKKL